MKIVSSQREVRVVRVRVIGSGLQVCAKPNGVEFQPLCRLGVGIDFICQGLKYGKVWECGVLVAAIVFSYLSFQIERFRSELEKGFQGTCHNLPRGVNSNKTQLQLSSKRVTNVHKKMKRYSLALSCQISYKVIFLSSCNSVLVFTMVNVLPPVKAA